MILKNKKFLKTLNKRLPEHSRESFEKELAAGHKLAVEFFQSYYGYPFLDLQEEGLLVLPHQQLDLRAVLQGKLAVQRGDGTLAIVFTAPPDPQLAAEALKQWGADAQLMLASEEQVLSILHSKNPSGLLSPFQTTEVAESFDIRREASRGEPVDQLLRVLLQAALMRGASDLHFSPETNGCRVRYRVDGQLEGGFLLSQEDYHSLANKIKLLGAMDLAEKRLPQEGHIHLCGETGGLDLRVASLHTYHGEKLVLRVLPVHRQRDLESLGFLTETANRLRELIALRQGLLLLTGPTNSGKTTTAYSLLGELKEEDLAIYTVEDPVEIHMPGLYQVQINRKNNFDFALALRGILRQDPDVIFIGEIRDEESAQIAVRAALTGHLILASLHVGNAHAAVDRLRELGVRDSLLSSSQLAVLNQRLLLRTCLECGEMSDGFCSSCHGRGHRGRIAVQELWIPDAGERASIRAGKDSLSLRLDSQLKGFMSLGEDGKIKARMGYLDLLHPANAWFLKEEKHGQL